MHLVVGLGNPGRKYARNRHNIGAMAVEAVARRHGFAAWRKRFQGHTAEGEAGGGRVTALVPATYMNLSGDAVQAAVNFFKLPLDRVIVAHDDLDLQPGQVRLKTGGGHGGHNGLKNIDARIGRDYKRLRLGIGHPGDKDRVMAYVLADFTRADRDWLDPLLDRVADGFPDLVAGRDDRFLNTVANPTQ